jgi:hypothetical protein
VILVKVPPDTVKFCEAEKMEPPALDRQALISHCHRDNLGERAHDLYKGSTRVESDLEL